ncbi:MAG TPA: hypothetical protein VFC01_25370 [Mycobacterium sp.]|nr:hypothetical protein [Mycobacterium sp.]
MSAAGSDSGPGSPGSVAGYWVVKSTSWSKSGAMGSSRQNKTIAKLHGSPTGSASADAGMMSDTVARPIDAKTVDALRLIAPAFLSHEVI